MKLRLSLVVAVLLTLPYVSYAGKYSVLDEVEREEDIAEIDTAKVNEVKACLKCHSENYFTFFNTSTDEEEKKIMGDKYKIPRDDFHKGVHNSFACTDCHSPEMSEYPHVPDAKMEMKYSCLDCHGEDEDYAKFHFDEIGVEVEESVHAKSFGKQFKCESCHSPHTYKLKFSNQKNNLPKVIQSNNNTCLDCHDNAKEYQFFSEEKNPDIEEAHKWLPNQKLHFKKVRCLECHTEYKDSIPTFAHKILPKEDAVKKCVECHSINSMLTNTLYKYNNIKARSEMGFYNSVILNDAYVIGANRSVVLNILSGLLFGLTFLGIIVHIIFRLIYKRTK